MVKLMSGTSGSLRLVGRATECQELDNLLDSVRGECSRALVLLGDPGIGKSALLAYAANQATGMRVLRVSGNQAETELAFAGLYQLVGGALEWMDRLPVPQRSALRVVFGLEEGVCSNRLVIALGVLGLISEMSANQPLICLVDDAQWLDSASLQALSFVARRLSAEPVGVLFAAREGTPELAGLATLQVHGLAPRDARTLLDSALRAPLDHEVRQQIVVETAGNPLALLELPRGVSPTELAGGFALPGATRLSERIEASYRRRFDDLPPPTQRMMLLAAADPVGDPASLWAAAGYLGLTEQDVTPAVDAELLEVGRRVQFRHPLARSAIYRAADLHERRRIHRALMAVTDAEQDPDRRAWHRAQAAAGPHEETAQQLEESARRAQTRGGIAAAAAFLERAATLTPAPERRIPRMIAAAALALDAGDLAHALEMLDALDSMTLSGEQAARVTLARGHIATGQQRGAEAVELLVQAAHDLKQYSSPEAHATVLEAILLAIWIPAAPEHLDMVRCAAASLRDKGELCAGSSTDLMIDGLISRLVDGQDRAAPAFHKALDAVLAETADAGVPAPTVALLWCRVTCAMELWDVGAWGLLCTRVVDAARRDGALTVLSAALAGYLAVQRMFVGDSLVAQMAMEEGRSLALAIGGAPHTQVELLLSAWSGDEKNVLRLRSQVRGPHATGLEALDAAVVDWGESILYNSLGRFDTAHQVAARLFKSNHYPLVNLAVAELAEAASRADAPDDLAAAEKWITRRAEVTPTAWCTGIAERVRALASEGHLARQHYVSSIDRLGQAGIRTEIARSHLLYGEWLRRHGGRAEARHHLRKAKSMFEDMGMSGFTARAARELRGIGDKTTSPDATNALTTQERQVARLAADGMTNPEIAARLFVSPRTVQYHLSKVFAKLAIKSRSELTRALDQTEVRA